MVDLQKNSGGPRMRWTDHKVRHLIQAVSYVDKAFTYNGKWKSVSELMMQKGFSVSPQQCLDKFHALVKRYKRMNDLLGIDTHESHTSCVENL